MSTIDAEDLLSESEDTPERAAALSDLRDAVADDAGGAAAAQHKRGKLTARERIDLLLDPGTFRELEMFRRHDAHSFGLQERRPYTDGVVAGWGEVFGRPAYVYADDFSILGGSLGKAHAEKIHKIMDLALATGCPLIAINDGAGARIQEGVSALAGYGGIFRRNVAASGVIPQLSLVLGPCAGGAAYSPALTDWVFTVRDTSQMFVTGPDVIAAVTGEQVTMNDLGGADVHAQRSGVASFVHDTEQECIADARYLLSLLPANVSEQPPVALAEDPPVVDLAAVVPADSRQAYDVRSVVEALVDRGEYIEVHENWARNIVCAFARIAGQPVGIVANQPLVTAGVLDIPSSEKASRFVSQCDTFNVPIITLVDVPGFMPGVEQEHSGIIRHGAKLIYAYCNATVPRIQVILRKAYGGAYIVMDSRSIGADLSFAWPTNEIAVMGPEAAANVVFRQEIAQSDDPDRTREDRVRDYRDELMHPLYAAERGLVDDVIDPQSTREVLVQSLDVLLRRRTDLLGLRRHGNVPL